MKELIAFPVLNFPVRPNVTRWAVLFNSIKIYLCEQCKWSSVYSRRKSFLMAGRSCQQLLPSSRSSVSNHQRNRHCVQLEKGCPGTTIGETKTWVLVDVFALPATTRQKQECFLFNIDRRPYPLRKKTSLSSLDKFLCPRQRNLVQYAKSGSEYNERRKTMNFKLCVRWLNCVFVREYQEKTL